MTSIHGFRNKLAIFSTAGLPLVVALSVSASVISMPTLAGSPPFKLVDVPSGFHAHNELSPFAQALERQFEGRTDASQPARSASAAVHYIRSQSGLSEPQRQALQQALAQGAILVIDNSDQHSSAAAQEVSSKLGGVGFDGAVVMIRKGVDGVPEYKELSLHTERQGRLSSQEIEQLATETHSMISGWALPKTRRDNKRQDQPYYRPEVSIPVELRYVGFPCMVGEVFHGNGSTGKWYWEDQMIDACDKGASVSLFYTIDLIRSVATTNGGADDAKYVRITVDPSSNGGAGWHLIDQPSHKHSWFQSWTNRETWFGPVADSYYVTIQSKDPDLHLFNTVPSNHPKESQIMHTVGLQVGVSGGPSLFSPGMVGKTNPLGFSGLTAGLSLTYTSERAISYNNHEYELTNLSRAGQTDKAAWVWSREFDKYARHWRTQPTCELWCQDWFYDDVAFSAVAYSSFTPGFSATFQVPAEKTDTSIIEFESAIKAVALGGRVQYAFLFQHYTPWGMKGTKYNFRQNLSINWGAAFFNAEVPTSLEAYKESSVNGLCLEVKDSNTRAGSKVGMGNCTFEQNQIWGMDSDLRYKSFIAPDRCLTKESDESLSIRPCTHSANQKWSWQDDRLINNLGGAMTIAKNGNIVTDAQTPAPTPWRNFIRKPPIAGTLIVSPLVMTSELAVHENDTNKIEDGLPEDDSNGGDKEQTP